MAESPQSNDAQIQTPKNNTSRSAFKTPRSTGTAGFRKPAGSQPGVHFKSPMRGPLHSPHAPTGVLSESELRLQLAEVNRQEAEVDSQIEELLKQGFKEEELKLHMTQLHEYNEIKDVAQMVLGRIAINEGVTTKDLYERYQLSIND